MNKIHHAQWRHLIGTVSLFWRHPDLKHNPSEPCCTISTFETLWTPRQSQEDVKIQFPFTFVTSYQWTIFVIITNSTWKKYYDTIYSRNNNGMRLSQHVNFFAKDFMIHKICMDPPKKSLAGPFLWYLQIYYVHHNSRFKNSTIVTT